MIQLNKSKDGQFYFVVKAKNGQTLVTSETYTRRGNALKGIQSLSEIMQGVKKGEWTGFIDNTKVIDSKP